MEALVLPEVGDEIGGRYTIEDKIGAGAMAAVFLATDKTVDRQVAIKVLAPDIGKDPTLEQRFENEAALGRTLDHPNTIQILDAGSLKNGLPYVVMEYLTGRTLTEVMEEETFSPERALRIGRQVLESLSEAHAFGIIHRDIKPTNIMIEERDDCPDFVKVLDFGIAKVLDESRVAHSIQTRTGVKMGSPTYMAPERLRSTGEPLAPSCDVYSAAIVMAELIKGEPIYGDLSPIQIFATHLEGLPAPLPESIEGTKLGNVLAKATSIPVEERYKTAAHMIVAIDRLLAKPDTMIEKAKDAEKVMTGRYEVAQPQKLPKAVVIALVALSVAVVALAVALVLS